MQVSDDRRARKKQAVRLALERAALDLFLKKGFSATTIDEIATAADFSRSTFFRHFGSKEAVVFAGFEEHGELMAGLLRSRPPTEGPLLAFEEAFVEFARHATSLEEDRVLADRRGRLFETDPDLQARAREVALRWQSRLAEILAEREGVTEPTPEHQLVAAIGTAVGELVGARWTPTHDSLETESLIRAEYRRLRELALER